MADTTNKLPRRHGHGDRRRREHRRQPRRVPTTRPARHAERRADHYWPDRRRVGADSDSGGIRGGQQRSPARPADKARAACQPGPRARPRRSPTSRRWSATPPSGIDERLGAEYGDYARPRARSTSAATTREKNADELIDDTRNFVRNSPGIALAGAAVVGFVLARLIKSRARRQTGGRCSD